MADLEELRQDLLGLSREELLERISDIREDRKISKRAISVKKEREDKKTSKLAKMFAEMTDEEKARLKEELSNAS
jgi:cytochrome c553